MKLLPPHLPPPAALSRASPQPFELPQLSSCSFSPTNSYDCFQQMKYGIFSLALRDLSNAAHPVFPVASVLNPEKLSMLSYGRSFSHIIPWVKGSLLPSFLLKPTLQGTSINAVSSSIEGGPWLMASFRCRSVPCLLLSPLTHLPTTFHTSLFSPVVPPSACLHEACSRLHTPCPSVYSFYLLAKCIDSKSPTCSCQF